jgi:hypothetical protein
MAAKNPIKPSNSGLTQADINAESRAAQSGIANKNKYTKKLLYITADNETVFGGNNNNSYIVLGKDRPNSTFSGYGGEGSDRSSKIDIVVGRISSVDNKDNSKLYTDNNFVLDAARIYIAEQTDIDVNFGLVDGGVGNAKAKSAIALKADGLRFIAREGIKLITKTDANNSAGVEIAEHSGIDLIANNDDSKLQHMVKGENLVSLFNELITQIDNVQNRIQNFIEEQQKFNNVIASHTHMYVNGNTPRKTMPNTDLLTQNGFLISKKLIEIDAGFYLQKNNFNYLTEKYLKNSDTSILSKYNRVN